MKDSRKGPHGRRRRGLTLIEILVVVTILGLIAGIVGVAVVGVLDDTKVDTTKTQMKNVEGALDIYKMRFGKYPTSTEGLGVLASPPGGKRPIMDTIPKDAWGNDFVFLSPGQQNPGKFDLYSKGPDEQGGTEDDITNWGK